MNIVAQWSSEISYLNILICDSLYMSISHFFIPDLQRFGANAVQYAEKSTLKSIFKHFFFWKINKMLQQAGAKSEYARAANFNMSLLSSNNIDETRQIKHFFTQLLAIQ